MNNNERKKIWINFRFAVLFGFVFAFEPWHINSIEAMERKSEKKSTISVSLAASHHWLH